MYLNNAILQNQEFVSDPQYDEKHKYWVISYRKGIKLLTKTFSSESAAFGFFYKKLREAKNTFIQNTRSK